MRTTDSNSRLRSALAALLTPVVTDCCALFTEWPFLQQRQTVLSFLLEVGRSLGWLLGSTNPFVPVSDR